MNKLETMTQKQLLNLCGFMFGSMYFRAMHELAELNQLENSTDLSDDEKKIHHAAKMCVIVPLFEYLIALLEQTNIGEHACNEIDPFQRDLLEVMVSAVQLSKAEVAQSLTSIYRAFINDFYKRYNMVNENGEKIESHLNIIKKHLKSLIKNN